jgi:hypothetical protein
MNAAIERWREAKQRKSSDLKAEQGLVGGRAFVERCQEPHGSIEHAGLRFVIGHALTNDGQRNARRPDRLQAPEDLVKRLIDRHILQVRELTPSGSKVRIHQHVRLQGAAKPALALSSAASERRDLAVVLG